MILPMLGRRLSGVLMRGCLHRNLRKVLWCDIGMVVGPGGCDSATAVVPGVGDSAIVAGPEIEEMVAGHGIVGLGAAPCF